MPCLLHNCFCFGYSVVKVGSVFNMQFQNRAVMVDPGWASVKSDPKFTTEKHLVNTSSHQNKFGGN